MTDREYRNENTLGVLDPNLPFPKADSWTNMLAASGKATLAETKPIIIQSTIPSYGVINEEGR